MERTMHWLPNCSAPCRIKSGFFTAAVLMEILSAPALRSVRICSTEETPPPTVSGTNTFSAVRRTTSTMVARPSAEAVISKRTSSSAPSRSYASASSTGSPASRKFPNRTPLTTRPSRMSRQGMMRFASILRLLSPRFRLHRRAHGGDGFRQIHSPRVEGLAHDGAGDAPPGQRGDGHKVLDGRDAARGDHPHPGGEHLLEAGQVGPGQRPVPGDVGE